MKTEITKMLGIRYPIFQGGMAWVSDGHLAAAVSNAGGLGIIGAGSAPGKVVQEEIKKARQLTDKPFGVNIMLMSPEVDEVVDVVCQERVDVVTTGAGNPGKYMQSLEKAGIKVFPIVPTLGLAKRLSRYPIAGIIAEGGEAGGHVGDVSTMVLVALLSREIDVPVIAAGGIADGRGLLAALALGAEGVQLGTVFVCTEECKVHDNYKKAILRAKERSTKVTGKTIKRPVRCIENQLVRKLEKMDREKVSPEEFEIIAAGSLREAVHEGDVEMGSLMAGQSAALVNSIKSVAEVVESIVAEAHQARDRVDNFFKGVGSYV